MSERRGRKHRLEQVGGLGRCSKGSNSSLTDGTARRNGLNRGKRSSHAREGEYSRRTHARTRKGERRRGFSCPFLNNEEGAGPGRESPTDSPLEYLIM